MGNAKVESHRADHAKLVYGERCVGTQKPKNDCGILIQPIMEKPRLLPMMQQLYNSRENLTTCGKRNNLQAEPELHPVWELQTIDLYSKNGTYRTKNGQTKPLARAVNCLLQKVLFLHWEVFNILSESYQSNEIRYLISGCAWSTGWSW